jgi:hypothetical protein
MQWTLPMLFMNMSHWVLITTLSMAWLFLDGLLCFPHFIVIILSTMAPGTARRLAAEGYQRRCNLILILFFCLVTTLTVVLCRPVGLTSSLFWEPSGRVEITASTLIVSLSLLLLLLLLLFIIAVSLASHIPHPLLRSGPRKRRTVVL